MRVYEALRQKGSLKIKEADSSGRSRARNADLPSKLYAREAPGEIEECSVDVDPDDMTLLELVSDDKPVVSTMVPDDCAVVFAALP